jgi:hypothetical protein
MFICWESRTSRSRTCEAVKNNEEKLSGAKACLFPRIVFSIPPASSRQARASAAGAVCVASACELPPACELDRRGRRRSLHGKHGQRGLRGRARSTRRAHHALASCGARSSRPSALWPAERAADGDRAAGSPAMTTWAWWSRAGVASGATSVALLAALCEKQSCNLVVKST